VNPILILKRVSFKHLLKGIIIGLGRPFFILPTLKATKDCLKISSANYGRQHQKNGRANAFRHAFWNYLIAKRCLGWNKNEKVVLQWAKKVTDWHETAFQNEELAKRMDLHNNEVGGFIFEQNTEKTEEEIIELLKQLALESIRIDESSVLSEYKNRMVHIL
tara:strand:- start:178 stop:663 length:486 start_codon:yes stop_codon:yes gene_type:complete